MAAGRLEVEIVARLDKLEQGLAKAEAKVKQTGAKMDSAMSRAGKMGENLEKGAMIAGKLALAAAAVDGAIKGATMQVHAMKGAFALLRGDSEGALEALEAYGETVRSLPLVGGILGGLADGIFGLGDAVFGLTENLEELDKKLIKVTAQGKVASAALDMKRQNLRLQEQLDLMNEIDVEKQADMQLSMDLADLEEKRKQLYVAITNEHTKGTRAHKVAMQQVDDQLALETKILETKHAQEEAARAAAAAEQAAAAEAARQAELEKQRAEEARQREREAAQLAKERAEQEKKIAEEKKKAADAERKALEEQIRLEQDRLGAINSRLGVVSKDAQSKTGFTNQGQTAFGAFTFGEQNVDQKIADLQAEALTAQQGIENKTNAIEQLLNKMANQLGFA